MTNRKLFILVFFAVIVLVATVGLLRGRKKTVVIQRVGTYLIQGVAPENIWEIEVTRGRLKLTLEREGDIFKITERDGYPASIEAVNKLIARSMDMRIREKAADSAESHDALGVSADNRTVTFKGKDGKILVGYAAGNFVERGDGMYARLLHEEETFATEEVFSLHVRPTDYIEKKVLDISQDDIQRVTVQNADSSYVIARDTKSEVVLENIPEGKCPKAVGILFEHDLVFSVLSRLDVFDVSMDELPADHQWDTTYTAELKTGAKYIVQLSHKGQGENYYTQFSAIPPPARMAHNARHLIRGRKESEEALKEREAIILADDQARIFNQRHKGWLYEVSELRGRTLGKPFAALIENAPLPEDPPEEIAARHILLAYAGAERSKATRTKTEANSLAIKVMMKARRPNADFAKVAEEFSDCSSKNKGGDLGTFRRGTMAKAFEDAAFKLKVGQLSGIVETPFGFHVIQRTE